VRHSAWLHLNRDHHSLRVAPTQHSHCRLTRWCSAFISAGDALSSMRSLLVVTCTVPMSVPRFRYLSRRKHSAQPTAMSSTTRQSPRPRSPPAGPPSPTAGDGWPPSAGHRRHNAQAARAVHWSRPRRFGAAATDRCASPVSTIARAIDRNLLDLSQRGNVVMRTVRGEGTSIDAPLHILTPPPLHILTQPTNDHGMLLSFTPTFL
jgi:hypothetical protein